MGWYSEFDVEINVFEKKESIIRHYSNEELKQELSRREKGNIIIEAETNLEYSFDIDAFDYNEFLDNISTDRLINKIESQGYIVVKGDTVIKDNFSNSTKLKELATWLGLRW